MLTVFAAVKAWSARIVVGYFAKLAVQELKKAAPKAWNVVPAKVKPVISTVFGVIAAVVAGDPTTIIQDVVGGAVGGAAGKVVHDRQKAAMYKGGTEGDEGSVDG